MGRESYTVVMDGGRFAKLEECCKALILMLSVQFALMNVNAKRGDQSHLTRSCDWRDYENGIEYGNHPCWSANHSVTAKSSSKRVPKLSTASTLPWDQNYMNLYTPVPNGGLVISDDGMDASLRITGTNQSFGHFQSKNRYMFGYFSMLIKLIPNESAGVIATYYFSSPETKPKESDRHDEIDFEFLGNTSGNPVTLQTNIYINGEGNREQHHYLTFDPTTDFHKYSLLWNQHLIIWFVDDKVIRVFHNVNNKTGVPYPVGRPLAIQCSIWDGSEWATQGGRVKLNYSYAPFVAHYKGFDGVYGCQACPASPLSACDNVTKIPDCYNSEKYWFLDQEELTKKQIKQLKKHQRKYIVYNYCQDSMRFPNGPPAECRFNSS